MCSSRGVAHPLQHEKKFMDEREKAFPTSGLVKILVDKSGLAP
jgi:hypothetical protein